MKVGSPHRFIPIVALGIFGCLVTLLVFFRVSPETVFFANDQALSFAVVSHIEHGEIALAGPPSHVGGRHLGPFFYWYLAGAHALGGDVISTVVVTSVLKLVFGVGLLWSLYLTLGGAPSLLALVGLLASFSFGYVDLLRTIWHPHILLLLSAFFLRVSCSVLQRGSAALSLWLFSASVLVQTHLAAAPLAVGVALVLLVHALTHRSLWTLRRAFQGSSVLWGLLAVSSCIPLLAYEAVGGGNLATLFGAHAGGVRPAAGGISALQSFGAFMLSYGAGATARVGWRLCLTFALGGSVLWMIGLMGRKSLRPYCWPLAMLAAGTLATGFALLRFPAPLYAYYWSALLPLPALLVAWLVQTAGSILLAAGTTRTQQRVCAVGFLVCLTTQGGVSVVDTVTRYSGEPFLPYHTLAAAEGIATEIRARAGDSPVEVFPRLHAKVMRNAVYFLLGEKYFPLMEVAWKFKEFRWHPSAEHREGDSAAQKSFLLICPRPYRAVLSSMVSSIRLYWEDVADVNLQSCRSCQSCRLVELRRLSQNEATRRRRSEQQARRLPRPRKAFGQCDGHEAERCRVASRGRERGVARWSRHSGGIEPGGASRRVPKRAQRRGSPRQMQIPAR